MKENKKYTILTIVNALIERFDELEEETGTDFTFAKRIILRWCKKHAS